MHAQATLVSQTWLRTCKTCNPQQDNPNPFLTSVLSPTDTKYIF